MSAAAWQPTSVHYFAHKEGERGIMWSLADRERAFVVARSQGYYLVEIATGTGGRKRRRRIVP